MQKATVDLPKSMALDQVLKFCRDLDYYSDHDRLILNMPQNLFFSPFSMLLLSSKVAYLREKCPNLTLIFNGWENYDYLSHMGFFSRCGFQHGREVGAAWGSNNYLPITCITRNSFYEKDSDKYQELPDLIQRHVDGIARVLSRGQQENSNMFDVLSFSVREIFRNVFEHSNADSLYFCAQFWPKSGKVEFSVSDFGIGVRRALSENPNFRFKTDKEALEFSLLPSVSGKTHKPRTSSTWFNSGYGLYMTSRLARNGGNFVIASGDYAIHLSRKTKYNYVTSFPGTALRLNLNVSEIGNVQNRLAEFRRDGVDVAARISGTGNRPPSAMSLLLRRDFQTR